MTVKEQFNTIKRMTVDLVPEDALMAKLERFSRGGPPLRIKYGADPSAPDLHLGHAVCFKKLKEFQELGHQVVFVIGDFTARIGDPTGRSETRKPLSEEQVRTNAATYMEQVYLLLDRGRTEVTYNSHWLSPLVFADILRLSATFTVARMLERDDFSKRHKAGISIGVHEFLYPVMVAYDSVHLRADVEMGGTDQLFNFLAGREMMQELGLEPQVALTMPILPGTDGVTKMSKSLGNYIAIKDSPRDMFGKAMSIPDTAILTFAKLAAFYGDDRIKQAEERMRTGNPRDVKADMAEAIAAIYHGAEAAGQARREFDTMFRHGGLPDDMLEYRPGSAAVWIVKLLVDAGCAKTNSDARRLVQQGAISIDEQRIADCNAEVAVKDGMVLKAGKRHFVKLRHGE